MIYWYQFLYAISSLSIVPWIYAINKGITLLYCIKVFVSWIPIWNPDLSGLEKGFFDSFWSYIIYFIILLIFAWLTTTLFKRTRTKIDIPSENIQSISVAGEEMSLTYFGLFFYALSVSNFKTLIATFFLLCWGISRTARNLFNPLYLFFGYKFYYVISKSKKILVLSKNKYQYNDTISFQCLGMITPFLFVELESDD